jgi:hypothetical protein
MKTKYLIPALLGSIILLSLIRRRKMSNFKTKLVELANQAWAKWNLPTKVKEGNPKTMQDLKSYYRAVGLNYGNNFKYGAAHSIYIQDAKNNREKGIKTFQAFKPAETKIEIGDLVCYPRQDGITYETPGNYLSHCDIITEITGDKAIGIGGNVSDSVSKSSYKINNSGKVITPKVHVIIKNYL